MNQIEFFVNQNIPWDGVDLYVKHDGAWVSEMQCVQIPECPWPPVAMRLTNAQAQDLMNCLYAAGFQPSALKGSEATLAAVTRHLEDMRTIAFEKLEMGPLREMPGWHPGLDEKAEPDGLAAYWRSRPTK